MAVPISTQIEALKRAVTAPGADDYGSVTDDQWVGYLTDAFWTARLSGLLGKYEERDAQIVPLRPGTPDIGGDSLQLVVLFAAYNIALTSFMNVNSKYRAKSGPVEYEVEKSATTLKALLDALKARMDYLLKNLSETDGSATAVAAFDSVLGASYGVAEGYGSWYVGQ